MNQAQRFFQVITIRELLLEKADLEDKVIVTRKLTPSFKIKYDPLNVRELEELAVNLEFGCLESDNGQIVFYSGLTLDEDGNIYEWEDKDDNSEYNVGTYY